MEELIDTGFVRAARRWLWVSTAGCVLIPMLVPFFGNKAVTPIALLPMLHCFTFWVVLSYKMRRVTSAALEIRRAILAREPQDGIDQALREFKKTSARPIYILMSWPFFLIPLSWLVLMIMKPVN